MRQYRIVAVVVVAVVVISVVSTLFTHWMHVLVMTNLPGTDTQLKCLRNRFRIVTVTRIW
jgi:hypothetical protein